MDSLNISKVRFINTDCSPSHLVGNLTQNDKNVAYIHNSEIQPRIIIIDKKLFSEKGENTNLQQYVTKLNSNETNEMVIARYVNLSGTYFMAVGLYGGFKLWSSDGGRLLFQIPCKVKNFDKVYAFTSICEYKSNPKGEGYDSLICGDNYGQIFLVNGSGQNWRAKLLHSFDGMTVTALTSDMTNEPLIYAAFENGDLNIMRIKNDNLVEVLNKKDNSLPCLTLNILREPKPLLICGFLNGEIKIYNTLSPNFELVSTLGDHLRMLTSVSTHKNLIVSTGDDCYVNIFKIDNDLNLSLIGNHELTDKMPVGALLSSNNELISCCYDFTSLAYIELI